MRVEPFRPDQAGRDAFLASQGEDLVANVRVLARSGLDRKSIARAAGIGQDKVSTIFDALGPEARVASPTLAIEAPVHFVAVEFTDAAPVAVGAVKGCRWPMGDVRAADFRFCDAPAPVGYRAGASTYCLAHARIAYRGGQR